MTVCSRRNDFGFLSAGAVERGDRWTRACRADRHPRRLPCVSAQSPGGDLQKSREVGLPSLQDGRREQFLARALDRSGRDSRYGDRGRASYYNTRFRRFASERWWERKADAYETVIASLTKAYMSAKSVELQIDGPRFLSAEALFASFRSLGEELSSLRSEVTRGALHLSEAVIVEIESFLDQAKPSQEKLSETVVAKLPALIEQVREQAKKNLGVR